jgi:hypothetical protein
MGRTSNSLLKINMAVLRMLGVPTDDLISATIRLRAGELPVVTCRYLLRPLVMDDRQEIASEVRRFNLTLIERDGAGG